MIPRSTLVPKLLGEYGDQVRSRMVDYLPRGEPQQYLYDQLADYPLRGGRSMRPTLCVATARAFGGSTEGSILSAVSIEMMHNAMLIHDDIEDESEERRGQPALHIKEGLPIALNAGDALSLMSMRPLLDNRPLLGEQLSLSILEETVRMARESAEGQALELGWRRDNVLSVGESDYFKMVLKKTCWLATIHPCRVGAMIGGCTAQHLAAMIRFGYLTGTAFQIQDDLLNLTGDATSYGKELGGDIYEGKRTLMLIDLYSKFTHNERERLRQMLDLPRRERTMTEIGWVRDEMDRRGSLDYARKVAHGLAGAARAEFEYIFGALPDSIDKQFLRALPTWVIERA